jgi:hypothetical protein
VCVLLVLLTYIQYTCHCWCYKDIRRRGYVLVVTLRYAEYGSMDYEKLSFKSGAQIFIETCHQSLCCRGPPYSRIISTNAPASGAGNFSESRLMSQKSAECAKSCAPRWVCYWKPSGGNVSIGLLTYYLQSCEWGRRIVKACKTRAEGRQKNDRDLVEVILLQRTLIISISHATIVQHYQDYRSQIDTHIHHPMNKDERNEKKVKEDTVL